MSARTDSNGYAEVNHQGMKAWKQGDNTWRFVNDGYTEFQATFNTYRERREDYSGQRQYRVCTEHRVTITLRIGYNNDVLINGMVFSGGEVATVKRLIHLFQTFTLHREASYALQARARKLGASDLAMLNAEYYHTRYNDDEETQWLKSLRNYKELVERLDAEQFGEN